MLFALPLLLLAALSPEEAQRQLERIQKLPPAQVAEQVQKLQQELGEPKPLEGPPARELTEPEQVEQEARRYFQLLLKGDARQATQGSSVPFQLEGRKLKTSSELFQEWLKTLRTQRLDQLTLYGIEVLTPVQMEQRYGKPPSRLAGLPWKAPHIYLAVGNLSGRAAILVFQQKGPRIWRAVGYTD